MCHQPHQTLPRNQKKTIKRNALVVAEQWERQGKTNSVKHVSPAVHVFERFNCCNDFCGCRSCTNPFGRNVRDTDNLEPLPRKRAKQDFQQNVGQTDRGYIEKKAEEPKTQTWLEDEHLLFEAVTLYLLMTEHDVSPSQIFSIYHKIIEFQIQLKTYQLSLRPKLLAVISKSTRNCLKSKSNIIGVLIDRWTVCLDLSCWKSPIVIFPSFGHIIFYIIVRFTHIAFSTDIVGLKPLLLLLLPITTQANTSLTFTRLVWRWLLLLKRTNKDQ